MSRASALDSPVDGSAVRVFPALYNADQRAIDITLDTRSIRALLAPGRPLGAPLTALVAMQLRYDLQVVYASTRDDEPNVTRLVVLTVDTHGTRTKAPRVSDPLTLTAATAHLAQLADALTALTGQEEK